MRVDLAFERAWRNWAYRERFPQVDTDLSKGTGGSLVMTHATELKYTFIFFWDHDGRDLVIYGRTGDWDSDDRDDVALALQVIAGEVPLGGWVELADAFLSEFDRQYGKDRREDTDGDDAGR